MDKKEFTLMIQTNAVKGSSSSTWYPATVHVDEAARKLHISYEKSTKAASPLKRHESSSSGSSDGVGKNITINLADFKEPKKKRKFPPPNQVVGIRNRWPVMRSSYLFSMQDENEFVLFFETLRRACDVGGQRKLSVSAPGVPGEPLQQQQPDLRQTDRHLNPVPSIDFTEFNGGEYATVGGDEEVQFNASSEFFNVEIVAFESFDNNRCFTVRLDSYEGWPEAPTRFGFHEGDNLKLYMADGQLELLSDDAHCRLLCSWPYTRIKSFGHMADIVRIEFGARSCTGQATLRFSFSAAHRLQAKSDFVADMTARLQSPAAAVAQEGGGRCPRYAANQSSSDSDDENADPSAFDEDNYAIATPDLYATVTQPQPQSEPKSPVFQQRRGPAVPPHPTNNEAATTTSSSLTSAEQPQRQPPRRPSAPAVPPPPPPSVPPPPRPPPPAPPAASTVQDSSIQPTPVQSPTTPVPLPTPPATLPKPSLERRYLSVPIPNSVSPTSGRSASVDNLTAGAEQEAAEANSGVEVAGSNR
ncbi:hypothetical protein BOX15_Mlig034567g1 [Macrostomum lignano]|uniref:IRS-type PTB domain-containing protein n=1 Tax=Macrostomum lignano TaxID=282301 RepID=A0A267H3M0_9PLAT|nr:hypothetical protein BOX15_Mlig034567g1 [Macrostomum lignano]